MFNRKSTATETTVTVQDGVIAEAWGYSLTAWAQLTDSERADMRSRIVYAPHFSTATA